MRTLLAKLLLALLIWAILVAVAAALGAFS
jgi:hypothetical protein